MSKSKTKIIFSSDINLFQTNILLKFLKICAVMYIEKATVEIKIQRCLSTKFTTMLKQQLISPNALRRTVLKAF